MQKTFPELVESLLVMEYGKSPEEALALVKKHTQIVMTAMMQGLAFLNVRACGRAIVMAEANDIKEQS